MMHRRASKGRPGIHLPSDCHSKANDVAFTSLRRSVCHLLLAISSIMEMCWYFTTSNFRTKMKGQTIMPLNSTL